MTNYEFGDIVLIPFPFTNQTVSKQRPAVIISSAPYNQKRPDLILMAITSQMKETLVIGEMKIHEWKQAGLLKPSLIKPIITTIEKDLILKKLGQLAQKDQVAFRENLYKNVLG